MADENLTKKTDLARVREIDFTMMFKNSIIKLMEAMGVTRKIPKQAGTNLKAYKASGTLDTGVVGEGETIPLSKYKTEAVAIKEITLKKWRKAASAEAITDRGYDQAVDMLTDEMLKDVQNGIRKDFFDFLATGTGTASGDTFQAALAQAWGQLQVLFENTDDGAMVYFLNPLDVADYLGSADITMQTVFGMSYVENFMGLGTVIFNSSVPKGKIYATAKENLVCYYIPVNGADLGNAFEFTADETGFIGIHEEADYSNMTCVDTVVCGLVLFAEKLDGVVVATIGETTPTIGKLTVSSGEGTSEGKTKLTVTEGKLDAANSYKYHLGDHADDVAYGQNVQNWKAWDGSAEIDAATGQTLTLVECDKEYKAVAVGSCSVTAKAGE